MPVQQTGLTQLGQALSGGASDFRRRELALQDEARLRGQGLEDEGRLRSQRLEDIASERTYQGKVFDSRLQTEADQAIALEMVRNGFLDPSALNDSVSVQAAYQAWTARVEEDRLALKAKGVLADEFALEQSGNAQASIDAVYSEMADVRRQLADVERGLNTPPTIDPAEVEALALNLARQQYEDYTPTPKQVQGMVVQAQESIRDQALQQWLLNKEAAVIQRQSLNNRLVSLGRQASQFTSTFNIAPSRQQNNLQELTDPAASVGTGGGERLASPEQIQAALDSVIQPNTPLPPQDVPPPGAPVTAGARLLEDPADDPLVSEENARRTSRFLGRQNIELRAPWLQAVDELADIEAELESARKDKGVWFQSTGPKGVLGIPAPYAPYNPSTRAKTVSNLLVKKEAKRREIEKRQREMLGLSEDALLPSQVAPPTISTPEGSVPAEFAFPDRSQVGR